MPFQLKKKLFIYSWLIIGIATFAVPFLAFVTSRITHPNKTTGDASGSSFNSNQFVNTYGQNNYGQNNQYQQENQEYNGVSQKYQSSSYSWNYKDYSYLKNNNGNQQAQGGNGNNRRLSNNGIVYKPWWWVWSTKYAPARPALAKFFVCLFFLALLPAFGYVLYFGVEVAKSESESEKDWKDLLMMLGGSGAAGFLIAMWIGVIDGLVAFDTYPVHQNGFYGQGTVLAMVGCLLWALFAAVFAFAIHYKTVFFEHQMEIETDYKMHDEESHDQSTTYSDEASKATF